MLSVCWVLKIQTIQQSTALECINNSEHALNLLKLSAISVFRWKSFFNTFFNGVLIKSQWNFINGIMPKCQRTQQFYTRNLIKNTFTSSHILWIYHSSHSHKFFLCRSAGKLTITSLTHIRIEGETLKSVGIKCIEYFCFWINLSFICRRWEICSHFRSS